MGDERPGAMNLDLNLGPIDQPGDDSEHGLGSYPNEAMNLEDWLNVDPLSRIREAVQRRQRWRSVWRQVPVPSDTRNIALEVDGGSGSQPGEGSVAAVERPNMETKTCENNNGLLGGEALGKKDDNEKGSLEDGSFFECHICLDVAKDPVVTCCGHLFCWSCLYRWLNVHSDAKECPVCKGEVTVKNVTPIYGRGSRARETDEDSSLKIPQRPRARRIESWRHTMQRTAFAVPMEEMLRRLGHRFDLSRDLVQVQPQNAENARGSPERNNSLLNRILTSRGMRIEHNAPIDDIVDLTESSSFNPELGETRRLSSLLLRRSSSHRAASISNLTSALSSAESLVESYFQNGLVERIQEPPLQPVDDRDSVSSIAAIIHSGSQTMDTAIEIDSNVSLSTLSSRRRNEAARISDMDSGDSRAPRRRRLN